jgi:hypothetical protein
LTNTKKYAIINIENNRKEEMKMPTVILENTNFAFEITADEFEMLKKKRAKDARIALRNSYIDEINELIARMEKDGFTLGVKNPKAWSLNEAKPWGDAGDSWIELK